MEPLSNRLIAFPSAKVSVRAGMRPFGLISRNQGSYSLSTLFFQLPEGECDHSALSTFWVSLLRSMAVVL
jgi:hypothetical protein